MTTKQEKKTLREEKFIFSCCFCFNFQI